MNIKAIKLEIIKRILETNDPAILNAIYKLFGKEAKTEDFFDTLTADQKEEIQHGIHEIESGDIPDDEDLSKTHRD